MLSSSDKKSEQILLRRINRIAHIICETPSRDACSVTFTVYNGQVILFL